VHVIHLTLVPYIGHAGELKTKPTQHSVNELRRIGIAPDMVVCRSRRRALDGYPEEDRLFASLPVEAVVSGYDVPDIYQVPLAFKSQGVDDYILSEHFGLEAGTSRSERLGGDHPPGRRRRPAGAGRPGGKVRPTRRRLLVGRRGAPSLGGTPRLQVEVDWVDSESVGETEVLQRLARRDGILIPGGFGGRGWEGKIRAARIAREQQIPYLGSAWACTSR